MPVNELNKDRTTAWLIEQSQHGGFRTARAGAGAALARAYMRADRCNRRALIAGMIEDALDYLSRVEGESEEELRRVDDNLVAACVDAVAAYKSRQLRKAEAEPATATS